MLHKTFDLIETKADGDDGTFEALVSVFGNVDSAGDRIQPGAFTKTLEQWQSTSDPIPVILSHQWNDPMAHIGVVYPGDAKETDRGLAVKGHLDVNDNEVAKQVHRLMKRRSLKEFSFGYRVVREKAAKDGANDLHEIELVEVGPTLKGANPETELHAVKSAIEAKQAPEPPSEADLRKKEHELRLEEATEDVPKGTPPAPDPVETLHAKVDDISTEFETFKAEVKESLAGIKAAVEEPRKEANTAKHDPLRRRSNQAVLEIQSDGISLRKSPIVRQEPIVEAPPEAELKARSRREMLELLTGVPNDKE